MTEQLSLVTDEEMIKQTRIAVRDQIRDHPETHDQGNWWHKAQYTPIQPGDCGTRACVAGWAVHFAHPKAMFFNWQSYVTLPDDDSRVKSGFPRARRRVAIDDLGREALGLTKTQAAYLFDGIRTYEDVLDALDALIDGRPDDINWEPFNDRDDDDWYGEGGRDEEDHAC